jgi:SAM-dependent methyltransferase
MPGRAGLKRHGLSPHHKKEPHPEERALARVSKDGAVGVMVRDGARAPPHHEESGRIARCGETGVPNGMATNPTAAPILFDRALLRVRQTRALRGEPATFLLDRVAEDIEERLHAVLREFTDAADIWSPGEILRKPLRDRFKSVTRISLDATGREVLPLAPESLDLAVSALAFQFVNDLPGVLSQVRRALRPDGLLLAAMLGGDTLTELRQSFAAAEAECEGGVSPRVAPFADLRDVGALLQRAGFALPVTDVDRVVVRYDSAFALMQDLRRMGATNILVERRRAPTRRATMLRMAQVYAERFADSDGRIRATFDVIWLSGWAPHPSQPKPLQPGSAKVSLAEAVRGKRKP